MEIRLFANDKRLQKNTTATHIDRYIEEVLRIVVHNSDVVH